MTYISEQEKKHLDILSLHKGVSTRWATNHKAQNPGFFTSFNQQYIHTLKSMNVEVDDRLERASRETFGMKQAVIAVGLLPALQLQTSFLDARSAFICVLEGIKSFLKGDWNLIPKSVDNALTHTGSALYFFGACILNFLKEVTALITRSIATFLSVKTNMMCINPYEATDTIYYENARAPKV